MELPELLTVKAVCLFRTQSIWCQHLSRISISIIQSYRKYCTIYDQFRSLQAILFLKNTDRHESKYKNNNNININQVVTYYISSEPDYMFSFPICTDLENQGFAN